MFIFGFLGLPPLTDRVFELALQNLELAVHGKPAPVESVANPPTELDDLVCDVCMSVSFPIDERCRRFSLIL